MTGAVIYTTRYPFSASVFQAHIMGVRQIMVLAHEWEPYYKDEFRRAARLARELSIAIEPYFLKMKIRDSASTPTQSERLIQPSTQIQTLKPDDYDPKDSKETTNDN